MKNYGFKPDVIKETDYYLGGGFIGTKEINPLGDWTESLPQKEIQCRDNVETMACTSFGTLNILETLISFLFKEDKNFSERYTAILSDTTEQGNSPQKVVEAILSFGLIDEEILPFTDIKSWDEYYSPKPMDKKYIRIGKKFLEEYNIKHEWVFKGGTVEEKQKAIREALKRSPVGVSVCAWVANEKGVYYKTGIDNHWTMCYGIDDSGDYKIYDSYDNTLKIYSKDSDIAQAKLYWIIKKEFKKKNVFEKIIILIKNVVAKFI